MSGQRNLTPIAAWAAVAAAAFYPYTSALGQRPDPRDRLHSPPIATVTHVTVTPYVGLYNPIGQLRADSTVEFLQIMSVVVGARVSVPVSQSFALEAAAAWTPAASWVAQSDWQQTVDVPGKVTLLSVRGRYDINPGATVGDWIVSLTSGLGAVHRYGRAWEGISGTTDAAFVVGGSARLRPLASRLSFGVGVDGFVSQTSYTDYQGLRTPTRLHADLVSSFALSLSLGRNHK